MTKDFNIENPSFGDIVDAIDPVEIDIEGISKVAKKDAAALVENLSKIYYDDDFMKNNPRIKKRIDTDLESLRGLIKMRRADEEVHDILIKSIGQNPGNASLYRSLAQIQQTSLSIQNKIDDTIKNLNTYLKNVQLELNFNAVINDRMSQQEVSSNTYRGSKDFIKSMLEEDDDNTQQNIEFDN